MKNKNAKDALQLLRKESTGILSTHSKEVEGYPFGSVTPYCLDQNFNLVLLVSGIAQHTKNMDSNPKVSLTVAEQSIESEKQALGRFTYIGDASRIENKSDEYSSTSQVYLRYFPAAKHYFEAHDFYFYRLDLIRGRYIEGFGKIHWIEKDQWSDKNVFNAKDEKMIIDHMNNDHKDALKNYCSFYKKMNIEEDDALNMIGIYQYGFDLLYKKEKINFQFKVEVSDPDSARKRLVEMAKEAKT